MTEKQSARKKSTAAERHAEDDVSGREMPAERLHQLLACVVELGKDAVTKKRVTEDVDVTNKELI